MSAFASNDCSVCSDVVQKKEQICRGWLIFFSILVWKITEMSFFRESASIFLLLLNQRICCSHWCNTATVICKYAAPQGTRAEGNNVMMTLWQQLFHSPHRGKRLRPESWRETIIVFLRSKRECIETNFLLIKSSRTAPQFPPLHSVYSSRRKHWAKQEMSDYKTRK